MTQFDLQYQKLLKEILEDGIEEISERTKHGVKALPGKTLELEPDGGFPLLTLRKIPLKIFIAEQIWFLMGSRRPAEFLNNFTKIWDDFTNLDGVVSTAYGYRWRHHFGRDQIALLINLLEKEPSSRHGVVVTWDPSNDGLSATMKKANIPCPYTFTVNIIGGMLHMHNIVRSNDMILGCPHDVAGFALLQRILAARLGVKVGKYTHSISNAHIYDIHYDAAKEIISRTNDHPKIDLEAKKDYFERAKKGDQKLVDEIFEILNSQYAPMDPIKGLKIVL
jgi:thymidylate synthase